MKYLLVNYQTNNKETANIAKEFQKTFKEETLLKDNKDLDYQAFMDSLNADDEVYLIGGDGTINYFVNHCDTDNLKNNVYYYPAGTGNDFANDINGKKNEPILINAYVKGLPTVEVKDIKAKFINGMGYGIDGYCCEVADKMKAEGKSDINYTSIAIKGLLFHYKTTSAEITVDGKTESFKKVWLAPSMKGRFYGGGMMVAPDQDRTKEGLSCVIYHTWSKLKALIVFPSIFKGEHVKKEKMVKVLTGKEIEVKFDRPVALQIDGETVLGVTEYKVHYNA